MKLKNAAGILSVVMLLAGCATFPPGPSVMVLPGNGKPFEAFQADDSVCRQWAQNRTEWNANQTANENLAGGAIVGGALGAASGALIGAASGNVGPGAAIGAGAGLLGGCGPGFEPGVWRRRRSPAALRQCLPAVHVCQGEPDSRARAGISYGESAAATPATDLHSRTCAHTASAQRQSPSSSAAVAATKGPD
jgi:hypothetical protein